MRLRTVIEFPSAVIAGCLMLSACGNPSPSLQLAAIDYRPGAAGAAAVELYDRNNDNLLSADELKACPGISVNLARYDTDGDGQVSSEEIAQRVQQWEKLGGAYLPFNCVVLLEGRPLSGANVELKLEPFLSERQLLVTGATGIDGMAALSAPPDSIPEKLRNMPLARPGLYKVSITHPQRQVPARYNSNTELGCEISPDTADPWKVVKFQLKGQ